MARIYDTAQQRNDIKISSQKLNLDSARKQVSKARLGLLLGVWATSLRGRPAQIPFNAPILTALLYM